jgi:transposase
VVASQKDIIITELKDTIADLRGFNKTLQKALDASTNQVEALTSQIAILTEKVEYLTRKLFGTSSEKLPTPGQLNLFDGMEEPGPTDGPETLVPVAVKPHTRKPKTTFDEKIKGLPVEQIEFSLSGEDAGCGYCTTPMEVIGREVVRREIELIPAKVKVLEYVSLHYGCPTCKEAGQPCIVHAPVPAGLMKHSPASPSTVSWVMYQKYHNGMPLYRQENDWKHTGFELGRGTMANWVIYCSEHYLKPIYD